MYTVEAPNNTKYGYHNKRAAKLGMANQVPRFETGHYFRYV